ncbi:MAG: MATE family efflux transporter [Lentisphaeria bacterium]|nr:MATE family efflux transporter [Lentisphaeria bacterium]
MATQSSEFMGTESVPRLLMRFALPAMASSFVNCLYNIVDRLYIGRGAGPDAMAGLALTFPYMIILVAFGMMIGQGSGAMISLMLGEKKPEEANKVLGQALALFLLFIVTFQALGLVFLDDLLRFFGGTEQTMPYAHDYLQIILWGNIFQHISFGMSNLVRSEGSAVTAMGVVILGATLNIILDPIFIFVFHMGIRGAAWATVISMAVSSTWVIGHFLRGSILRLQLRNIRIFPKLCRRVLAIGLAPCLMQCINSVVFIAYNRGFLRYAGSAEGANLDIAAFGIINAILMMTLMPTFGINMGVQPIIGFNAGAKKYNRVTQALKLSIKVASVICFSLAALVCLFARPLSFMFTGDEGLLKVTAYGLRAATAGLGFIGIGIIVGTYYQSIGHATTSIVISLLRQGVVLIPTLLLFPYFWGVNGIWWAGPFSDAFTGCLCAVLVLFELKRLRKLIV